MKELIPIFEGYIVDAKLKLDDQTRKEIARWCSHFNPRTHVEIIIRKFRKDRTDLQNKYYWGVVIKILADHFGYEPEELHEELKIMFNPVESKIRQGEKIGGSTTKMSTLDFMADDNSYIEKIRRYFAQPELDDQGNVVREGIYIPDPKKAE